MAESVRQVLSWYGKRLNAARWPVRFLLLLVPLILGRLLLALVRETVVPALVNIYVVALGWIRVYLIVTIVCLIFVPSWGKKLVRIGVKIGDRALAGLLLLLGEAGKKKQDSDDG